MRDLLLSTVIFLSLPVGLFRPFLGLLVYVWVSYMFPQEYAWGFAKTLPIAKMSALSVILGTLINGGISLRSLRERENRTMLMLLAVFTWSTVFSIYPMDAFNKWLDVTKMVFMGVLGAMLLTDRKRVRWFFLVLAISLGFYGFKGGLFSILTGGEYMIWGPGSSILGGNNNIGLALNMVLPVIWYAALDQQGWRKRLLQIGFLLTIPAIMFTYSRASAITLPFVILAILLSSKRRVIFLGVTAVVVILAIPFVPQSFWNRQQTVLTYEDDSSANSRFDMWKIAWRLTLDRPLTGGGFNFQSAETFNRYGPEILAKYEGKVWDTHSIYLSILAGHGFFGLFVFLSMIAFCLLSCKGLERSSRDSEELAWIGRYAAAIRISFIAFLINGAFVNMEYFDLIYQFVGVVACLKVIYSREVSRAEEPVASMSFSEAVQLT